MSADYLVCMSQIKNFKKKKTVLFICNIYLLFYRCPQSLMYQGFQRT